MDNQKSELQEYINHLTAFVAKLAPDGTILMVNAAATDLVGVPARALLGQKIWDTPLWVNSGRERTELQKGVADARSGENAHFEFTYRTPDECTVIVDLKLQPVQDESDGVRYIIAEGRDISEFRQVEAALRESEARFRSIFENAPVGIFQATVDGRFVLVNNTLAKSFGYDSPDEIMAAVPTPFAESLLVQSERWPEILRTVIATNEFCRFENDHRRRDGSIFIANVYIRAVKEGERVVLLEGFEEDITERVRAEQKLAEEKRLSETIINSIPGLFYMINQQGKLIWWNDYRDQVFAYKLDEQGYTDILPYVLEADRPLAIDAINRAFSGERISVELRLPHKDGEVRDYYCTGACVEVGGEPRLVGVAIDITDHKRAEEEKRAFYRETIKSVTQGKLDLVPHESLQGVIDDAEYTADIAHAVDVTVVRTELESFYESKGLRGDAQWLFMSGVGEAMTNAIKHAGKSRVYAGADAGCVWSMVSDNGPGIAALAIPSATLRRGFSTKVSLGMGYSIMLDSSDAICLATGTDGTTVVLIKELVQPEPELSLEDLPDTWGELPVS